MSFRQDRTNPSTAVSNWRGRSETPKGWPSTQVDTWMNGGLFSGGGNVTGGTRDESHGDGYIYEIFYTSGTMVVTGTPTIDLFICGGGGGAAKGYNSTVNSNQGGGGAAGWTGVANLGVAAGSYSVVIGAGGAIPGTWSSAGNDGNDSSVALTLTSGTTTMFASGGGGKGGRGGDVNMTGGGGGRACPTSHDGTSYSSNVVGSGGSGGGGGVWQFNSAGGGGAGGAQQNTGGPSSPAVVTIYTGSSGGSGLWTNAVAGTGGSGTGNAGNGSPSFQPPDGAGWNSYPGTAGASYTIFCAGGASGYSGLTPSGNDYIFDATSGSGNSQTYQKTTSGANGTVNTTTGGILIVRFPA